MDASIRAADWAFCSPQGPEVFHSVQHKNDVWKVDPFDVESIHREAREVFARLVDRVNDHSDVSSGRILLLKGESGAGKTHLMRAFRNEVHGRGLGFFGYMQLTSKTTNYSRYILRNVVDSLDKPYYEPNGPETGLMRLSNAFAEAPRILHQTFERHPDVTVLKALREEHLSPSGRLRLIQFIVGRIPQEPRFDGLSHDLVRAMLFLQTGDPFLKNLVVKYLRCEPLSSSESEALGGIASMHAEENAAEMLERLGQLIHAVTGKALVICADQLEDILRFDAAPEQFRLAAGALRDLIDSVPNAVVVISCIRELYLKLSAHLEQSTLDRIERDPTPVTLTAARDRDEVFLLAEKRLRYLYDSLGVDLGDLPGHYPFTEDELARLAGIRTRDVLDWMREFQTRCKLRGTIVRDDTPVTPSPSPGPSSAAVVELEQEWNDHLAAAPLNVPSDEEELLALLRESLERSRDEDPALNGFEISLESGGEVDYIRIAGKGTPLALRVCDKAAQGGWLTRQLEAFERSAPDCRLVILRSTAFPSNPRTEIARKLGSLVAAGAVRFQVEASEWHAMEAMRSFEAAHRENPHFLAWRRIEKPLTRQPTLQGVLGQLETSFPTHFEILAPVESAHEPEAPPEPRPVPAASELWMPKVESTTPPELIEVGETRGLRPEPVALDPEELTRHAAFLGGTGTGKTTLALHIIEQLVMRGIPAILIDRKGDLCGYARSEEPASEQERALREQADIALYTPGDPRGRDLYITLLPSDAAGLPSIERDNLASYCADALAGMMNYRSGAQDQACRGILKKAVEVMLEFSPDTEITVESLCELVESKDPALLNAVGSLRPQLFTRLAENLRVLLINRSQLLKGSGEQLSTEALLGLGPFAKRGKTRLSIISTRFIGDSHDVEFWMTQFLIELGRWAGRAPSPRLQGVVFFDEADIYLPANRRPSTKGPMEDLLKRARSAGLGLLLATQSPGDFDYKCRDNIRTWFLGRIKEETALRKMRPMLNEAPGDIASLLPGQSPGEFQVVRDGRVERMLAHRSIVKPLQAPEDDIRGLAGGR